MRGPLRPPLISTSLVLFKGAPQPPPSRHARACRPCRHEGPIANPHVRSGIHPRGGPLDVPRDVAEVVVLAGDVARPREAIARTSSLQKPDTLVPGNHELCGSIDDALEELRSLGVDGN